MRLSIGFFFTLCGFAAGAASRLWVVAPGEVTLSENGQVVQVYSQRVTSWSLDAAACALYGSTENGLVRFTASGETLLAASSAPIISPVTENGFLTSTGSILQAWSIAGVPGPTFTFPAGTVAKTGLWVAGSAYLLTQDARDTRLDLQKLDPQLQPVSTTSVVAGTTLWTEPFLRSSPDATHLWLGYSRTKISSSYSPVFEERDLHGKATQIFSWPDRGLFLGMCATSDGRPLVVRDLPSSTGFTLPVYSLFEIWKGTSVSGHFASEMNWLTHTVSCVNDEIYFTERSLNGGGYRLSRWSGATKVLFSSPEPLAVAACAATP